MPANHNFIRHLTKEIGLMTGTKFVDLEQTWKGDSILSVSVCGATARSPGRI